jgi:hypothetical protein
MHPIAVIIACCLLVSCARTGGSGRATGATESRRPVEWPATDPFPVIKGLSITETVELVSHVWFRRERVIADDAVLSRRSMYRVVGEYPDSSPLVGVDIRKALYGDTSSYERQPPIPERLRHWDLISVTGVTPDSAELVGRLTYRAAQHSERFFLGRHDGLWAVRKLEIGGWTYY